MFAGLLIAVIYAFIVWLVFFKFKWLRFSIAWGVVSVYVGLHLLLIFMIGLRFMTPYSSDARVIQHTIQLTPRLTEPTLVTAVLVEQNTPVRKGEPLFRFDRRPYEFKVKQHEAKLAQARQNVQVLKADVDVAAQKLAKAGSELEYAAYQQRLSAGLAQSGAGADEEAHKWAAQLKIAEAAVKEARAEEKRARLRYDSETNGVNTAVAAAQAELDQARFYLENTTLVAPEDGYLFNLQVRPGMVAGDVRFGAIAAFVCDADSYILATYNQENLKYVKIGQPVEVAFDLYPGQIFRGRVSEIWRGNGSGQLLPSGTMNRFDPAPPGQPQGHFAVAVKLDAADVSKFPIGAQAMTAIYTEEGGFAYLRRIAIRANSWLNWLYPFNF